jgi:hypothetical protein
LREGSVNNGIDGRAVVITVLLEWLRFVEGTIEIGSFVIAGIPGMRMVTLSRPPFIILYRREGITEATSSAGTAWPDALETKRRPSKMARSVLKTEKVTIRFGGLTAVGNFTID